MIHTFPRRMCGSTSKKEEKKNSGKYSQIIEKRKNILLKSNTFYVSIEYPLPTELVFQRNSMQNREYKSSR